MEFNFINPGRITTKFETVVIMRDEFEIKMFEDGGQSFTLRATTTTLPPSAAGQFIT